MTKLMPDLICGRLFQIDLKMLSGKGIRFILVDLDNTLTRWKEKILDDDTIEWVNEAKVMGLRLCIVSNSNGHRPEKIASQLNISYIKNAAKPLPRGIKRALALLDAAPEETAIAGDQLYTDVLGGKRAGLFTILLNPIHKREFIYTRCVRIFEKRKLRSLGLR